MESIQSGDHLHLDRLLAPASIAIVGASARPGSIAAGTIGQLVESGYPGELYLVNPRYRELFGHPCYPDLQSLPRAPDLVVFAISGLALEAAFDQALQLGVGGILIYAANHLAEDRQPPLPERLRLQAAAAGIPVLGGNSMGFYNYDDNVLVSFDRPPERPAGGIALIAHSGSAMTYLANNDARFCYNFVISSGQETNATVADYMGFVLARPSTRVVTLFLETVRDAPGFIAALEDARARNIPVLIVKLGRTEKSAALALTHSGAIVGDHDAFLALCRRTGALVVRDMDEMMITALLFSLDCRPAAAGIAAILDSGGMRELMLDLAHDHGVGFAEISPSTRATMDRYLEPGLEADNPLDAMGALGRNSAETFTECGKALLDEPATGLLLFEFEFRDGFSHYPELFRSLETLRHHGDKPVVAINSLGYAAVARTAADLCHSGIPCINGVDLALRGIRNLLRYHRESARISTGVAGMDGLAKPDGILVDRWRRALRTPGARSEAESLALLSDFGLPVTAHQQSGNLDDLHAFALREGYPVVLKTAAPGLLHKSDVGGVLRDLGNPDALSEAYRQLSGRLGPEVVIMRQIQGSAELAFGMRRDPQFGPLVMVAAGGTLVELLDDRAMALAPFDQKEARALIGGLQMAPILAGIRGRPGADMDSLAANLSAFSQLAAALSDVIAEMDINPVIVGAGGAQIVDALVVTAPEDCNNHPK